MNPFFAAALEDCSKVLDPDRLYSFYIFTNDVLRLPILRPVHINITAASASSQ